MKRLIDYYLNSWKSDPYRMPLLLRGARQVGKTFSVRKLGESFPKFVEINLEETPEARIIFEKNLDPDRMIAELSVITQKNIIPGSTLLFIDEIQVVPRAITALRYFYEKMPELHVVAAGSLLDFAIEQVGIPVGRVQSLYMFPLSFVEFLAALNHTVLLKEIIHHNPEQEMSTVVHDKALALVGDYLALGGMPQVVARWQASKEPLNCAKVHATILDSYRQDFEKYAKRLQIKYVESVFKHIPVQLGRKFKYTTVEGDYRKRELAPALDLLVAAGVVHKVFHSSGQGIPLGAQADPQDYKVIFLDIALAQTLLDLDISGWFLDPLAQFVNKGSLVEALVGQEMLAYESPHAKKNIYYWHRESRGSEAEIDYLIQLNNEIIPLEVKSGSGKTLKSLQLFLESHMSTEYGIRISTNNYSEYQKIKSLPLYAVAQVMSKKNKNLLNAIMLLIES
ncbi:ATP-binding protein [Candidatus Dependentiae bacterium]|nr:ATP-binding protein [Candidatus Dependentiae bacterium]